MEFGIRVPISILLSRMSSVDTCESVAPKNGTRVHRPKKAVDYRARFVRRRQADDDGVNGHVLPQQYHGERKVALQYRDDSQCRSHASLGTVAGSSDVPSVRAASENGRRLRYRYRSQFLHPRS